MPGGRGLAVHTRGPSDRAEAAGDAGGAGDKGLRGSWGRAPASRRPLAPGVQCSLPSLPTQGAPEACGAYGARVPEATLCQPALAGLQGTPN